MSSPEKVLAYMGATVEVEAAQMPHGFKVDSVRLTLNIPGVVDRRTVHMPAKQARILAHSLLYQADKLL